MSVLNKLFIAEHTFLSLKQSSWKKFVNSEIDAWEMAKEVKKKPSFAIEVLLNSEQDFTNWNIPAYIREGLRWLQID